MNDCNDLLFFNEISIRIDFQFIYVFIFSNIISNVIENFWILVFIKNRKVCIFRNQFLALRTSFEKISFLIIIDFWKNIVILIIRKFFFDFFLNLIFKLRITMNFLSINLLTLTVCALLISNSTLLTFNISLISTSFRKYFKFFVFMYFSRLFQTRMMLMLLFLFLRKFFKIFQNRADCSRVVFFNFEKLKTFIDVKIIMKFEFVKSNIIVII